MEVDGGGKAQTIAYLLTDSAVPSSYHGYGVFLRKNDVAELFNGDALHTVRVDWAKSLKVDQTHPVLGSGK